MKNSLFIFAIVALLVSCKQKPTNQSTPVSGDAKIACDETLRPVFEAEIDVFAGLYADAVLHCQYLPEAKTLNLLFDDSISAAVSTRRLTEKERNFFKDKKIFPREVTVAIDAIALIVNKNSKDTLLTVDQVRDILTGKITKWNQLNPNSPNRDIQVVFDHQNSSIVSYFNDSICNGKMDVKRLYALKYNRDVIDYVSKNKDVLGFVGVNWLSNRNDSTHLSFHNTVKAVAVSRSMVARKSDSYLPYQAYMVEELYPFTRNVYYIVTEPYNGLATGFSNFLASERGQRIVLKSGILPALAPTRLVNVRDQM